MVGVFLSASNHLSKLTTNNLTCVFCVAQLLDTKSTDRKMTLLHYIALIVKERYPELANFYNEMHFVDKAAAGEFTHPGFFFKLVVSQGTAAT